MLSTHAAFKKLVSKGMGEELAEAITEIMEEKQDGLVTKNDLRAEMAEFKTEIAEIKTELKWMRILMLSVLGLLIKVAFFN